jgi:hypothetical protein
MVFLKAQVVGNFSFLCCAVDMAQCWDSRSADTRRLVRVPEGREPEGHLEYNIRCRFPFRFFYFGHSRKPTPLPEPYRLCTCETCSPYLIPLYGQQFILTLPQFQKIFVLNLPFRTDRRDAMSLSAAISNIKLEFVDGVTADSIKQSAYPPPDENLKLLPGIRGSWRTHMNALQRRVCSSEGPVSTNTRLTACQNRGTEPNYSLYSRG